ncbi:hypothetical protein A2Y47_02510 [Candidatus Giovannonibacteria bacterium RIFCSPLOWO2_12_43_8]|uniref:Recombinase domain-containing protein n=1 Tax=Candidatus Giovannonibacteria bacterium RIFCSPLOWO2_12_43_8 TaxID=1798361 RepID=A0A1F5Y1K9_9BACT|nr:MAG: hypothetical protein A2Y47_02510 [Candidatus Giovannonibacteria bacterium RIFCSPLOWO2_12_43_8]
MIKYFIYCRKSSEDEERQVLSIEAQLTELREFAKQQNLFVVKEFYESKTAKEPGREVFNEMLGEIEKGVASGILAWNPLCLARNSIDGGKVIYFVDTLKIVALKFPTFWFEATPQGKFMLSVAFGQAKYYTDNLRENILRGIRQKIRRGELSAKAPLGYFNEPRLRTIEPDKKTFAKVKECLGAFATGQFTLTAIQRKMFSLGLVGSRSGKPLVLASVEHILKNPFYYGHFQYRGEVHQGSHKPMISKKLFDKCAEVMADKSRPKKPSKTIAIFRGLLHCAECGCAITSEIQKGHQYYRCIKKRGVCSQGYVREEVLAEQITDVLQKVSLPSLWADNMLAKIESEREHDAQNGVAFAQNLKQEIEDLDKRLDKLLDTHLDGLIPKVEYAEKKQKILNHKIDVSEKLKDFEQKGNHRREPMRLFILDSKQAIIIASEENLEDKKNFLKKIGSNHLLDARTLLISAKKSWEILLSAWDFNSPATFTREARVPIFGLYSTLLRG